MSPSHLGVLVCAKRAAAAHEAGGGNAAAGDPVAAKWLGNARCSLCVLVLRKQIALLWWQATRRMGGAASQFGLPALLCRCISLPIGCARLRWCIHFSSHSVDRYFTISERHVWCVYVSNPISEKEKNVSHVTMRPHILGPSRRDLMCRRTGKVLSWA